MGAGLNISETLNFVAGGGKMGALIRDHNWASTPIGPLAAWPLPLRTAVRILLNTGHPMYIFWGREGLCLYNDAYSQSIGPERHPSSLGRPAREVWDEIWPVIGPQIEQVMAGRGATWHENQLLPITRNGRKEDVYWTYSYGPIDDESGPDGVGGVLVVCTETTEIVRARQQLAEQSARQHRMFESAPGFITILSGPEHVFEFANKAYVSLVGQRDLIGRSVREAFPEIDGQGFHQLLDQAFATGERFIAEQVPLRLQRYPGESLEERVLDFIYEPMFDDFGQVSGIFVEGHDVTDRTLVEAALAASETRYRQIVEGADDFAIVGLDDEGVITSWNSGAERLLGYGEAEAIGRSGDMFFTAEDCAAGESEREMSRALQEGRAVNERWHVRKDGTRFWGSGLMMRQEGQGTGLIKIFQDRTAQHESEQQLRESEERFRQLAETVQQVFYVTELEKRRIAYVSPAYERIWGRPANEIIEDPFRFLETIHPDDRARIAAEHANQTIGRETDLEYRIVRPDGSERWIRDRSYPVRNEDGVVRRAVGLAEDITEPKLAEQALVEARAKAESLAAEQAAILGQLAEGVIVTDAEGQITFVNEAAERLHGVKKLGVAPDDYSHTYQLFRENGDPYPASELPLSRAVQRGETLSDERWLIRRPDGSEVVAIGSAGPVRASDGTQIGALLTVRDDTARSAAEAALMDMNDTLEERVETRQAELAVAQEALRQSQKLEAMGQLTGGVAHDFNNLLTPIIGSLDLLNRKQLGDERQQRLIGGALQSAERAKTLVQRLLAFARRQPLQPIAVDLGALVTGMIDLIASTIGPQIKVVANIAPHLPPARADVNQTEMALLNLSVNARDAMPDGGVLTVSVDRVERGPGDDGAPDLASGSYVRLSVSDTGLGMDADTLRRAVEPFFSTKGVGKGTGLGLSMVHGLALQLDGGFNLSSQPGLGTNAEFWLPVSDEAMDAVQADAPFVPANAGAGDALVVDDEDLVRASTADMIAELGYRVTEAASGVEAMALLEAGRRFDLLVTDHLMPGISGTELARAAQALDDRVSTLIVSGYADLESLAPDLPRLPKPFRQAELAEAIARLKPEPA